MLRRNMDLSGGPLAGFFSVVAGGAIAVLWIYLNTMVFGWLAISREAERWPHLIRAVAPLIPFLALVVPTSFILLGRLPYVVARRLIVSTPLAYLAIGAISHVSSGSQLSDGTFLLVSALAAGLFAYITIGLIKPKPQI